MARLCVLILFAATCCGCLGPQGRTISAEEFARMEREQAASREPDASQVGRGAIKDHQALQDRAAELKRERAEVTFELSELSIRRERLILSQAGEQARRELALSQARERLVTQRAENVFFTDVERGMLVAEDALGIQQAQDDLLQSREELAQLELMYGADPDEATAEIVVARSRRRLSRAEEQLRLAGLRSRLLKEVELPKRAHEAELALQSAQAAVTQGEREVALGDLDRGQAERALDQQEALLKLRLEDLERRELQWEEDRRGWERAEPSGAGR